jgi:hypothetical protein
MQQAAAKADDDGDVNDYDDNDGDDVARSIEVTMTARMMTMVMMMVTTSSQPLSTVGIVINVVGIATIG